MSEETEKITIETAEYDNFFGQKTQLAQSSLDDFFGGEDELDDEPTDPNDPDIHWQGLPEHYSEDRQSYHRLIVNFHNEEGLQEFIKLTKQKITKKTKSVWFPKADDAPNSSRGLFRWENEEVASE